MQHGAGPDVSVKETSVWIVDEHGKLYRERKVLSHPEDFVAIRSDPAFSLERERALRQNVITAAV